MKKESKLEERTQRMLLEAEPHELRGQGDSEIARLVRSDPQVRAAATRILDALHDMDAALGTLAGAGVDAGFSPTTVQTSNARAGLARAQSRTRRSARQRAALIASAGLAAAALAGLLLVGRPPVQDPTTDELTRPLTADLAVESERPFAVFETRNPNIAVVWLFEEEK